LPSPSFASYGPPDLLTDPPRWSGWSGFEALAFNNPEWRLDGLEPRCEMPPGGERVPFWTAINRSKDLPRPHGVSFTALPKDRVGFTIHVRTPWTLRALRQLETYVEEDPYRRFYLTAWWRLPAEAPDLAVDLPLDHPLLKLDTSPQVCCFGMPWPVTGLAINPHRSLAILEGIEA